MALPPGLAALPTPPLHLSGCSLCHHGGSSNSGQECHHFLPGTGSLPVRVRGRPAEGLLCLSSGWAALPSLCSLAFASEGRPGAGGWAAHSFQGRQGKGRPEPLEPVVLVTRVEVPSVRG